MKQLTWRNEEAAQLAEFAVALPLLVVFVVGIFDFSGAFTLKQKLTNVARDAARTAAADPTSDLQNPSVSTIKSVSDAFYLIDNYLNANNINDCGVKLSSGTATGTPLTWQFAVASSSNSPCGITIIINRGYYLPLPVTSQPPGVNCVPLAPAAAQTQLVGTCVSIQYTYPWRFGQVASLLGNNAMLPSMITAAAVAENDE